jgi:hypothetical protein
LASNKLLGSLLALVGDFNPNDMAAKFDDDDDDDNDDDEDARAAAAAAIEVARLACDAATA